MLKRTSPLLFAVIAFIVGLNLRPILASVGPLFSVLQREAGLTATQFSLLTTMLPHGVAAHAHPFVGGSQYIIFSCVAPGF